MIRTLIVDDEPLARLRLRTLLASEADFDIVGEAGHGKMAVELIEALRPDLVFLDIQMPAMTGFEVITAVGAKAMPVTVFVTAYDAFAVRAFEVEALDYLLKPYDEDRFGRVLNRVRTQISKGKPGQNLAPIATPSPDRLIARSRGKVRMIAFTDIDWIGAAGDYAEAHVEGAALLINESMTALAERLPADQFARIHRGVIVRLDRIAEIRRGTHGDAVIVLKDKSELRLSRRYRQVLQGYLS